MAYDTKRAVLCEKTKQYLYSFLTSCTQPCPSDLSAHTHPVCGRVCARALAHAAFTRGVGVNAWRRACLKRGADANFFKRQRKASANQIASCKYPIPFMQHQRTMWLIVVTMTVSSHASDTPSVKLDADAPCECSMSQSALTHTSHTGCVCALRSLGHGVYKR